jgi:hypothetical protein
MKMTFPEELRDAAKLSRTLEATDESGKALTVKDFAKVSWLPRKLGNNIIKL